MVKFVVPDSAITASGRMVQCGSCGNKWKQFPTEIVKKTDQLLVKKVVSSPPPVQQKYKKQKSKKIATKNKRNQFILTRIFSKKTWYKY